eukprot:Rhum_TRINITY_DN1384_c0_g2::Rhum_TRINITY_DN1384_c0_g2_i1::g.4081::m.4081
MATAELPAPDPAAAAAATAAVASDEAASAATEGAGTGSKVSSLTAPLKKGRKKVVCPEVAAFVSGVAGAGNVLCAALAELGADAMRQARHVGADAVVANTLEQLVTLCVVTHPHDAPPEGCGDAAAFAARHAELSLAVADAHRHQEARRLHAGKLAELVMAIRQWVGTVEAAYAV